MQFEDIRLYLMNRSQQNRLSILKLEFKLCPKVCKRLYREMMSNSKWLACWSSHTRFKVKNGLGYKVSLWTWIRGHVVLIGNGTSLVFHVVMQFHAYSSIGR